MAVCSKRHEALLGRLSHATPAPSLPPAAAASSTQASALHHGQQQGLGAAAFLHKVSHSWASQAMRTQPSQGKTSAPARANHQRHGWRNPAAAKLAPILLLVAAGPCLLACSPALKLDI